VQTASSIQTGGVGATRSAWPETRIRASEYDDDTSIIVGAATAAKRQAQLCVRNPCRTVLFLLAAGH